MVFWESKAERASFPMDTFNPYFLAHWLYDYFDNRQSESRALRISVYPVKWIEYMWEMIFRNAHTCVHYFNKYIPISVQFSSTVTLKSSSFYFLVSFIIRIF